MTSDSTDIYAARLHEMHAPEERSSPEDPRTTLANPAPWLLEALGAGPSMAGPVVSERSALNVVAVYSCVRILSETIGSLPLVTYERLKPRGRQAATDHPAYSLLHDAPNPDMTSMVLRETLMAHVLLWGNAYCAIAWNGAGEPSELIPIEPHRVRVGRDKQKRKVYEVSGVNGTENVGDAQMLHVPGLGYDGLKGYSVVAMMRQACGLALAAEEFGARFFSNGASLGGVLQHPKALSDKALEHLRATWTSGKTGLGNAHKPAILEEGMTYNRIGIAPDEAQFLETRKFQRSEIAGFFRVPPHMIGDLDKATFSNIEQQSIEFVTHSVRPWAVRFEQEYNRKLFLPSDRRRYYAEHSVNGLLRGDLKGRYDAYAVGRQNGWLSANDIRELENLNPIEGGDAFHMNGNMIPIDQAGQPAPNDPPDPRSRALPKSRRARRATTERQSP